MTDICIIISTKQNLLYSEGTPWTKKGNGKCDVTMGSWDGAEVCDLIGLYFLSKCQDLGLNLGLYRDDGLVECKKRPQQVENLKKKLCKVFKDNGLNITAKANKKVVNFLDVTLDLSRNVFKPYMKPNNPLLYVHNDSNHPPSILKNIPLSVNKRLSELSKSQELFDDAAKEYQTALNNSGYNFKMNFDPPTGEPKRKKSRRRNITWFNPPYSKNVDTNLGKEFFKVIDKCFPPGHVLHPVINRNTVKLSYSCLPNMGTIIDNKNKQLLKGGAQNAPPCDCLPDECPVEGKCKMSGIIYQAKIDTQNSESHSYIGLSEHSFIQRYSKHLSSFRIHDPRNSTSLSKKVLELQRKHILFDISWKILQSASPYKSGSSECRLCISEIFYILFHPADATLNSRQEFSNKCRHQNKFKLCNI